MFAWLFRRLVRSFGGTAAATPTPDTGTWSYTPAAAGDWAVPASGAGEWAVGAAATGSWDAPEHAGEWGVPGHTGEWSY